MIKQVACALAAAEQEIRFEHRDCHCSNLIVCRRDAPSTVRFELGEAGGVQFATEGLVVRVIDVGFSRAELGIL